jgi:hypothetical protein
MAYTNNNGQVRIGVRAAIVNSPITQPTISASLLQSLYGVWNGDTTINELGTSLYGVWNAEYSGTASLETSLYGVWNGDVLSASTLKTSLYAVYNGENNTNDSFGTNNGTAIGSVTYGTGKMGNAFQFNGSSFVKLPENSIRFTNSFSVSFWLRTTANQTTTERGLIADYYWSSVSWGYYISLRHDSNKIRLFWRNGSTFNSLESSVISLNQWNHVCVVWDKANTNWKIYINGVLDNQISTNSNDITYAVGSNRTNIGGMNDNSPESLNGSMDSINFWSKAITQAEVTELYNSGNGTQYVSNDFYKLSTNDSFGTNHGTTQGGLTYGTGKIGNAFVGNGTNAYVGFPDNSWSLQTFSINVWVYLSSSTTNSGIIGNYYWSVGNRDYGYVLEHTTSGSVRFYMQKSNDTPIILSTSWSGRYNSWKMITITKLQGGGLKMYVDGSLVTSNNSPGDIFYNSINYSSIGALRYLGVTYAYLENAGKIDGVNIWQRELTANEVSMLYNGSNGTQYQSGSFGLTQSSLDSFGTYHGTLSSTSFGTGKFGSAFNFTGGNINMGTGAANFGTNPFTISLWFYPNAGNNLQMLVAKGFTGGTDKGFYLNTDNRYNSNLNGISFGLSVGGGTYRTIVTTSAFPYTAAAWNHLVVTRSGNTTLIYLNGVLASTTNAQVAGTGNVSGDISNTGANMLLAQYGSGGLNFSGRMDALTMWNRAISLDEVTQLYNSGTGTQYPFVGTFSSAGNQLGMDNGTLVNGCSLTTGKIGQAFTFDGVNDYVSLPDNSFNFTGDFSVSAWINVSNVSGEKFIISNVNGNGTNLNFGWVFGLLNNQLSFGSYGNTVFSSWNTSSTLLANTWYHVLVTKKPSESPKLYINGVLSTSTLHPNSSGTNSTNPVYSSATYPNIKSAIGTYIYNNGTSLYGYWNGKIDALNVYQKELTQSEITELYNSGNGKQITTTSIVKSGLILNLDPSRKSSYPNSGTTWNDISGNGYNGTMVNGPVFGTASGGEITFDGVNDYASFPVINTGNVFTVQVWAKISRFGGGMAWNRGTLVNNSYNWGGNTGFFFFVTSQAGSGSSYAATPGMETFSIAIGQDVTGASAYIGSLTNYVNKWVNLTAVLNGTNPIKLYINGVEVSSYAGQGNGPSSINYTSNFVLGSRILESCDFTQGAIGSVHMYNRSLSATEILQNYNATKSRFGY